MGNYNYCHPDNATNFISCDSIDFAKTWVLEHLTSWPYHVKSNGKIEAIVKLFTTKMLLLLKQSNIKELNETEGSKSNQRNIDSQEKKL